MDLNVCLQIQKLFPSSGKALGENKGVEKIRFFPSCTGLPTKDETSETIVLNIYCLFSYIIDSLQL